MSSPASNASGGLNLARQEAVNFMHNPRLVQASAYKVAMLNATFTLAPSGHRTLHDEAAQRRLTCW